MPTWPIRVVDSDGELGESIASISRSADGDVSTKGQFGSQLLDQVMGRAGTDESGAVDILLKTGWSNGYLALDLG